MQTSETSKQEEGGAMAPTVTPQTVERIYGGHTNFQPIVQVRV